MLPLISAFTENLELLCPDKQDIRAFPDVMDGKRIWLYGIYLIYILKCFNIIQLTFLMSCEISSSAMIINRPEEFIYVQAHDLIESL